MMIRIAGLADDSIVDGPGLRLTVFTQGCPHACPGCHNPQTHDFAGGKAADTETIIAMLRGNSLLDGVTLSGGEPFQQPEPCCEIALAAKAAGLNVWGYSGYTYEALAAGEPAQRRLLAALDVLVDGPFLLEERTLEKRFRGSANQRLIDVPASLAAGHAVEWEEQA